MIITFVVDSQFNFEAISILVHIIYFTVGESKYALQSTLEGKRIIQIPISYLVHAEIGFPDMLVLR